MQISPLVFQEWLLDLLAKIKCRTGAHTGSGRFQGEDFSREATMPGSIPKFYLLAHTNNKQDVKQPWDEQHPEILGNAL